MYAAVRTRMMSSSTGTRGECLSSLPSYALGHLSVWCKINETTVSRLSVLTPSGSVCRLNLGLISEHAVCAAPFANTRTPAVWHFCDAHNLRFRERGRTARALNAVRRL